MPEPLPVVEAPGPVLCVLCGQHLEYRNPNLGPTLRPTLIPEALAWRVVSSVLCLPDRPWHSSYWVLLPSQSCCAPAGAPGHTSFSSNPGQRHLPFPGPPSSAAVTAAQSVGEGRGQGRAFPVSFRPWCGHWPLP